MILNDLATNKTLLGLDDLINDLVDHSQSVRQSIDDDRSEATINKDAHKKADDFTREDIESRRDANAFYNQEEGFTYEEKQV